ncbi:unnamed protein product [Rhizoctonia solani]|uniref:Aminoglycoside phosphotransferase domain-containing protein n=1 Tax=Rhizoctonia solani TaxID=456999 RepID=A0A8H3GRX6_9AGAM|nr:unnamed protein product [Rhizoctonia solani]
MADPDLSTPTGLATYLASTPYASTSIETISGGYAAFVYRVTLKEPLKETGGKTVVVKHSLGYAAQSLTETANAGSSSGGTIKSVERMDFEHEAFELVASNPALSTVVHVPRVHAYDRHTHTLIMSDAAPCQLLSTVLQEADDELIARIGRALGDFMGQFHKWTSLPEQAGARKRFLENKSSWDDVLLRRWRRAIAAVKKYGLEPEWMAKVQQAELEDAQSGGPVICMADFWFDNILVSTTGDLQIVVVDWETVRTSRPELDVALLMTDAWALEHVQKSIPLMREFFKAYKMYMALDETHMAMYAGRDVLSYGVLQSWVQDRDESVKQSIVRLGLDLLEAVHTNNKESLKKNPVLADMYRYLI